MTERMKEKTCHFGIFLLFLHKLRIISSALHCGVTTDEDFVRGHIETEIYE